MSDADLVAVGVLSALAVIVTVVLVIQIRKRRRLAGQNEIVVPVMSEWKGVVILLPWIAVAVLLDQLIARLLKGWKLGDVALASVPILLSFALGGIGFFSCMRLTRSWRREGELRCTADRLSLVWGGQLWLLDLRKPFELFEWSWTGSNDSTLQAVVLRQEDSSWGFTYQLAVGQDQYDNSGPVEGSRVMLGPNAGVIHQRLRMWRPSGGRAWL